jgi:hypothetical protein
MFDLDKIAEPVFTFGYKGKTYSVDPWQATITLSKSLPKDAVMDETYLNAIRSALGLPTSDTPVPTAFAAGTEPPPPVPTANQTLILLDALNEFTENLEASKKGFARLQKHAALTGGLTARQ